MWGGEESFLPEIKDYHQRVPVAGFGLKGVFEDYRGAFEGEVPETPDAFIDPLNRWLVRLKDLGLVALNLPEEPEKLQQLYDKARKVFDEGNTPEDPWQYPIWFTGKTGRPRVTGILGMMGEPTETADPIFLKILREQKLVGR